MHKVKEDILPLLISQVLTRFKWFGFETDVRWLRVCLSHKVRFLGFRPYADAPIVPASLHRGPLQLYAKDTFRKTHPSPSYYSNPMLLGLELQQ